ncbi:MAG: hypothetical protein NXH75_09205 [Halobacteriovoraceae bacterium]|nr:hypothetical protein [Halobacteriovoraceae bacterium]
MKKLLTILLFIFSLSSFPSSLINEDRVYYHLHRAVQLAELHYSQNKLFAIQEMRNQLGIIKYNEPKLTHSLFYKEFLFLNKLGLNIKMGSLIQIENLRKNIHFIAEKNGLKHPTRAFIL